MSAADSAWSDVLWFLAAVPVVMALILVGQVVALYFIALMPRRDR